MVTSHWFGQEAAHPGTCTSKPTPKGPILLHPPQPEAALSFACATSWSNGPRPPSLHTDGLPCGGPRLPVYHVGCGKRGGGRWNKDLRILGPSMAGLLNLMIFFPLLQTLRERSNVEAKTNPGWLPSTGSILPSTDPSSCLPPPCSTHG